MFEKGLALLVAALLLSACAGEGNPPIDPAAVSSDAQSDPGAGSGGKSESKKETGKPAEAEPVQARSVDPRKGGFEIALGEWAISPEAPAIRTGEVTFLIRNRGTMPHGFEIELEGDSSGSGSGDLFKAESELLQPGESTRMTVDLSMEGVYKIECLVDGHDDMGMEGPLEVRADAPLVKEKPKVTGAATSNGPAQVAISNFAFDPSGIEVKAGTEVTWSNDDPVPHTVTATDGAFDSDILDAGGDFSFTFEEAGTYSYRCNVHPDMKGTLEVTE